MLILRCFGKSYKIVQLCLMQDKILSFANMKRGRLESRISGILTGIAQ